MNAHAEIVPSLVDRIKKTLVGLKMPRAIEILDVTLRRIEQGEMTAMTNGSLLSEKPASKYELVINLKTAKALGLDVPLLQSHSAGLGGRLLLNARRFSLGFGRGIVWR